ncbi:MAG TPA: hypothetical protein VEX36_07975 [Thermoleophilaceae bacterium]|nr:hypothetical protein [Thermoleophilaceae bacterium]
MTIARRFVARLIVAVAGIAVALSFATGCGSDDSAGLGNEEDQIKQMFNDWQDDFAAGNGNATCAKLTRSGQQELAKYRDVSGYIDRDASCEEIVSAIVAQTQEAGVKQQPARALSVRVDGDTAVAQVSDAGRPAVPVKLVKQGDEWKLPSAGFGPVTGGKGSGE